MRAGKLRHYITLQLNSTSTRTVSGGVVETYTDNFNTYAEIWDLRGREYVGRQQIRAGVTHMIKMRFQNFNNSTEITPENARVSFKSKFYNIEHVENMDMRDIELRLMCSEGI